MPEIKAFNGYRYNPKTIRDFKKVLAPPYDVISKKEQEALYKNDPHNVIRLELGKDLPGDNASENKYTRARHYLSDWIEKNVLIRENEPAFYVYRQSYPEKGKTKVRIGFIAAMKIDEKAVLKHENTLAAPKADRLNLIKETRTNLSPIWGLYEDKPKTIYQALLKATRQKPIVSIKVDGVGHELFCLTDHTGVETIQKAMKSKPMFIADGHHRFETACNYRRFAESQKDRAAHSAGFVMTYFSDCTNNPFTIYPTHRLVSFDDKKIDVLKKLETLGSLRKVGSLKAVLSVLEKDSGQLQKISYDFGVFYKGAYYLLSLKPELVKKIPQNNPVESLDVAVLHRAIVEPIFGIKKIEKSQEIDFTRDANDAVMRVKDGSFKVALFLRPTSLEQMLLASKKGLKMPQKSTYFYPKLLSGLVFHRFETSGGCCS